MVINRGALLYIQSGRVQQEPKFLVDAVANPSWQQFI